MAPRRSSAVAKIQPVVRCATYSRVSTHAQADKEFNSVEAQREACESYVGLHRSEGWSIGEHYQDAGLSGSNTSRPGLQRLLADIEAGEIQVVVVYKFDRLSRSMLDFLQILDFFKRHGVSFVSVSQRFDTSTPVGEMTLNVLLSFAQFERQIIAERTRDKIHAARRRGRWTGGAPPLGYDVVDRKLVINKDEAPIVRQVFELYAETPSLVKVAQELNRRGWRRKSWKTRDGKRRKGGTWNRVSLKRFLNDPAYIGRVKLKDETFPGEHRGIVPNALFKKVQGLLAENRRTGGASARNTSGALLRGLLRCSTCDATMHHTAAKSHGKAYRYYRCNFAKTRGRGTCPTGSVSAPKIEEYVVGAIRQIGANPELQEETFQQAVSQVKAKRRGFKHESKRLVDELGRSRKDIERLVATVARLDGAAAEAVASELTKAQERVRLLEQRQAEIGNELADLATRVVDREELARALEAFDPIWDVLLTPEKERVLRLLIERIDYDGSTQKLEITWRLAGFGQLAAEVAR